MPASYAHYRFGRELIPMLPPQIQRSIRRFRQLYDMGLQGPDILFYHNIIRKNKITKTATFLHKQTGADFFHQLFRDLGVNLSEGAQVYLWGLAAHYTLDSRCHPLIHAHTDDGSIGHVELETEFNRFLLEKDHREPHSYDLSPRIRLSRGECVTVSEFYPPFKPGQINTCVRNMRSSIHLLSIAHGKNRRLAHFVTGLAGGSTRQFLMGEEPNPKCAHLNGELLALYSQALALCPALVEQIRTHMADGSPLGTDFLPTFG